MSEVNQKSIVFVCTGHVDHGKSTICGHILYKTKFYSEHVVKSIFTEAEKNKMGRWKYAWLLDTMDEERRKGKTLDYNIIDFTYNNQNYTMIDTPGHKQLVRSLISGINNFKPSEMVGCVIISVEENEFLSGLDGGQTKEDIILLKAVGINNIVIVFNKMDLIDWDIDIMKKRQNTLALYIKKMGFSKVNYIGVSGYNGCKIFDLLELIKSTQDEAVVEQKIGEPQLVDEVKIQLKIIDNNTIVSGGYECMIHIRDKDYQVLFTVVKLYDTKNNSATKIKFGKEGDVILAKIKCLDESKFQVAIGDRVIIRRSDTTIAFGRVM